MGKLKEKVLPRENRKDRWACGGGTKQWCMEKLELSQSFWFTGQVLLKLN